MKRSEAAKILSVSLSATVEEVNAAYRRLAAKHHPDNGGEAAKFQQLCEAVKVMRKPVPKAKRSMAAEIRSMFGVDTEKYMAKKETMFSKRLTDILENGGGAMVFNVHGHAYQEAGWPDLQVYHPVWTGHLELKCEGNSLSKLQAIRIRELRRRGTSAYCLKLMDNGDMIITTDDESVVISTCPDGTLVGSLQDKARTLLEWLAEIG